MINYVNPHDHASDFLDYIHDRILQGSAPRVLQIFVYGYISDYRLQRINIDTEITSFVQYNRPCLPVLFWRVVFRNRTGIIHFRLMKMISFQCKTAKNQFYLLMMLIVNKTLLNLRSQNRTRKTGFGCASTGFARPILGPSIFASSYFQ